MINLRTIFIAAFLLIISGNLFSQELDELLNSETKNTTNYTSATFKASRIINGHSIEQAKEKQLDFRISHRFGTLNEGTYGLFGLDHSEIHFSLEYGIKNWLNAGVGRASKDKTYDAFAKAKILRQSTGEKNMPVSLSYFSSVEYRTIKFANTLTIRNEASRLAFVQQILLARKFNDNLSVQLSPTFIHRNLVISELDKNDLFALGIGVRHKISKRVSLNGEYFYSNNSKYSTLKTYNVFSLGVDIETGGHVFQIMLTNSQGMREGSFIPNTSGNWMDGDIHLGFNISRVFSLN